MNPNARGIWDFGSYFIKAYGIYKVCESTVNYFTNQESTRNKTRFHSFLTRVCMFSCPSSQVRGCKMKPEKRIVFKTA